jgi:hypothetical protein
MDNDQKRKILKGALLVAMAGITLTEAERAMAATVAQTGVVLPGFGQDAFVDNDAGPTWVEFIKHDGGTVVVSNPGDPVFSNPVIGSTTANAILWPTTRQ